MYNLVEYSDNYSKRCGNLWQCYGDKPSLNNDKKAITGANHISNSFSP